MTITIEFDLPLIKPFYFTSLIKGNKFTRIGAGFVAVSWIRLDSKQIHDHIASGATQWDKE
jgi:hypothetical protein